MRKKDLEFQKQYMTRHLANLKALGYIPDSLEPIQALEATAHAMAEDECNGVRDYNELEWDDIRKQVKGLFSKNFKGFIINFDARGYSLKIDDTVMRDENYKLHQDMGGYGILSPEF